jgi:methyltransferase
MTWVVVLVAAVGVERLAEMAISRRNTAWSMARGGREYGAGHYPVMVALHVGLLAGIVVEVAVRRPEPTPALVVPMLVLVAGAQALRWWCIAVLGRQWNTRVIVVPGLPRVTGGPYRFLAHPNYVAVVVEGLALPLACSAWVTAVLFTVANAALLAVRIRTEERAIALLGGAVTGGVVGEQVHP